MAERAAQRRHFCEIIRDFANAFLVTRRPDGSMHARPLAVAEVQRDGRTFFATSIISPKVAEIFADDEVIVTFQSAAAFACMSGKARIVQNPNLIERLWSESWRTWFPSGRDDPSLCLIEIDPREVEFWDNSEREGLSLAIEQAKPIAGGLGSRSQAAG
ncbi:MAG: pyridoxamine 5'-phosphate oxidase family protein [Hyphomicrobium sp.]|jgi:general stress protein 26